MLRNCSHCGRLHKYGGRDRFCSECREAEHKAFNRVRAYLQDDADASVNEIIEGTGIDRPKILEFLRQGRLIARSTGDGANYCSICDTPVERGRICRSCSESLQQRGGSGGFNRAGGRAGKAGTGGESESARIYALERRSKGIP